MKKLSVLLIVAMLASVLAVAPVSAQGITWTSGFQVQNLEGAAADILISYYNQDGSLAIDPPVSDTIPALSSKTYYPIHPADGFNGSVVVTSTKLIVAIANTLGNNPQYAASTESFAFGANEVKLPLIMRGNSGYYTWFNVQNAGDADATVTVAFVKGSAGNNYTAPAVTIAPGAAATFNQRDLTELGDKFIGSAVITSNQPVVASVMQVGETFRNMMGYNGFTGGSPTVSLPLIMANNSGYFTGFQVQNAGGSQTTVTISYGQNLAGSFQPVDDVATLQPNESKTFIQNSGQFATNKYVGSATITSTGNVPVVAIVNQVKQAGTAVGTAYDGFDPANATEKVSAPLIMANNSGYYTGIQVMNVGDAPVDITVTYGPNIAGTFNPPVETATLQPGNSYNSIQSGGQWAGNKYVGSLSVSSPSGSKVVMIVNEIWPAAPGDQFMTYNGFNY